ncbi:MAG: endonuclease/exonuclease/phosphatase family protein [Rikenellaceae bacterium]|jgi:endonuclease/exonuclease/phosphatase family metal-dependent hydrolase|nr:endonuclease/exonuclease/phosphatase family protein [Rikenellaceae bacterium]
MKKTVRLTLLLLCVAAAGHAQRINVASYNIRYDNEGDAKKGNGWALRGPIVCTLVRYHDFDIFGAQEVLHSQLQDMSEGLPDYSCIGVGRDDGRQGGEHSPIFYKKEVFELLDGGTFWLSETPDKPSVGWDAALPRICTWGHFRLRATGGELWFFNTHFDHVGVKARKESARLILEKIGDMADGYGRVILTGDFNVDQRSDSYAVIAASGMLADCYALAEVRHAQNGTFNSFNPANATDQRIDHIFIGDDLRALRYAVLTDMYWSPAAEPKSVEPKDAPTEMRLGRKTLRTPSDHYPVAAQIVSNAD